MNVLTCSKTYPETCSKLTIVHFDDEAEIQIHSTSEGYQAVIVHHDDDEASPITNVLPCQSAAIAKVWDYVQKPVSQGILPTKVALEFLPDNPLLLKQIVGWMQSRAESLSSYLDEVNNTETF